MSLPNARVDQQAYPRVLLVSAPKVRADDPLNLLVRTQFGDWPADRLAQIHSGDAGGSGEFCGRYYRLGTRDRALGGLFARLRNPVFDSTMALESVSAGRQGGSRSRSWVALKRRLGQMLVRSGLWEVIFRVRMSAEMERFIEQFAPEVIYCQGYSLGFAELPLMIARRFSLPIVFQTTDDWPTYTYRRSPVGIALRGAARRLIRFAAVRLAFGGKMRDIYERRYGLPFVATYHLDNVDRFPKNVCRSSATKRIVFTGNLLLQRHEAIEDLLAAVREARDSLPAVEIVIYCPGIPKEMPDAVRDAPEVRFEPLPGHADLPAALAAADLLFLPESFNVDRGALELSISTKCHLYMMSGVPILVYGPPWAGSVQYARENGWAVAVERRDRAALVRALRDALTNQGMREHLTQQQREVAARFHELKTGRHRFAGMMRKAARPNAWPVA